LGQQDSKEVSDLKAIRATLALASKVHREIKASRVRVFRERRVTKGLLKLVRQVFKALKAVSDKMALRDSKV
jgi:hypothetical protein